MAKKDKRQPKYTVMNSTFIGFQIEHDNPVLSDFMEAVLVQGETLRTIAYMLNGASVSIGSLLHVGPTTDDDTELLGGAISSTPDA